MNRARQVLETISLHIPYEGQLGTTSVSPDLQLTPGTDMGYTPDYTNPDYAYGGGWWELTGLMDIEHWTDSKGNPLPRELMPFLGRPSELHNMDIPDWNKGGVNNPLPYEYTLQGAQGALLPTTTRGEGHVSCPPDYTPTGKHTRPLRLAE